MNYESIANLVHDCVRNPKMLLAQNSQQGNKVKSNEFTAVQKVLSGYRVSGGAALITASPMESWM
ncbi:MULTISPECIES: hypothetical protein [Dehalobacter]|jgi:hypothetical protein|uniref:Uncharacterized protein n=1 Tax=Dehalobacter restrictus (strain DSM 9455 / PER-K23) TaxID=871738 RepID=A0ABM5P4N1_DEHRP|nr:MULTISPECIES: hypothetical protein [Dehalobacter]AHF09500.1 hypothetical protein DEHRE_04940 [Dehalobacter restrictus DSM 9455]MCG1025546.1 hypothetical protein [Dehalobacter sp.]MDJ0304769.1 hypothetical protein [Dehalobacter sp.]OCZ54847.1 hypothetical protein A7D23_03630 [Dehalobacter sp. TeCB1]